MKKTGFFLKPFRPAKVFDRSKVLPGVQEMITVHNMQQQQVLSKQAFLYGWKNCPRCTQIAGIKIPHRIYWFAEHVVRHRLYASLGLEQEWVEEFKVRRQAAQAKFRQGVIRSQVLRKLSSVKKVGQTPWKPLRMGQGQRTLARWYCLKNIMPLHILPACHHGIVQRSSFVGTTSHYKREFELLQVLVNNVLGHDQGQLLFDFYLTAEQRTTLQSSYRVAAVADKHVKYIPGTIRMILYEERQL